MRIKVSTLLTLGLMLAAPTAVLATPVFNDDLSTSSLNSGSPSAPTPTSTSYQMFSSKTWSPAPTIGLNDLKFGIAATTSGHVEAQALFTTTPVTLGTVGDYVELQVVFVNTSGLLAQSGSLGFGLYNSGGVGPLAGGMNSTAVSSTLGVTGGAQGWLGYVNRIAFNAGTSRIALRPGQSITTGNNQDLVTEGSGSQSYAGNINLNSLASTLTLTAGSTLTENFRITLSGVGTYQIDGTLYSGAGTGGSTLYTETATGVTGANFINGFDSFGFGWRATANTFATTLDINSVLVNAQIAAVPEPGSASLLLLGLLGAGTFARRRQRQA